MEEKTQHQENKHFPVDREAPVNLQSDSSFNFYIKNKKLIYLVVFLIISVLTIFTVSLSIYIIFSKYI